MHSTDTVAMLTFMVMMTADLCCPGAAWHASGTCWRRARGHASSDPWRFTQQPVAAAAPMGERLLVLLVSAAFTELRVWVLVKGYRV